MDLEQRMDYDYEPLRDSAPRVSPKRIRNAVACLAMVSETRLSGCAVLIHCTHWRDRSALSLSSILTEQHHVQGCFPGCRGGHDVEFEGGPNTLVRGRETGYRRRNYKNKSQ